MASPPSSGLSQGKWSLYTLIVNPDNSFEVWVNGELKTEGNLLEDMKPSVNPPKEIDDPNDKKPSDVSYKKAYIQWVDEEMMDDPDAVKPDDWDEDAPKLIPDESAEKPEDW